MTRPLRVVVAGRASVPDQGGWTWALLQYVLGFRELGHDVFWLDVTEDDSDGVSPDSTVTRYFRKVARGFDLETRSALIRQHAHTSTAGADIRVVDERVAAADVLLNVSGALSEPSRLAAARRRVYLDLDPGFTQLWQAVDGVDMRLDAHTDHVTIGPALVQSGLPTLGRRWLTTLQPVVLSAWPEMDAESVGHDAFTTVANWRGYGSVTVNGTFYGQKAHSFRAYRELPLRSGAPFLIALSIHPDEQRDISSLRDCGWRLLEPRGVVATPEAFQRFVQASRAEIAMAKSGYAVTPTGWFSDRSICYLASGRPVVAQDTGIGAFVPTGCGLVCFGDMDEAVEAVRAVRSDYRRHARRARAIAREHFDSRRVLTRLLDALGIA